MTKLNVLIDDQTKPGTWIVTDYEAGNKEKEFDHLPTTKEVIEFVEENKKGC